MRTLFALVATFALVGLATPVAAAETVSQPYNGAIGGPLIGSLIICPAGCDLDDDAVNPGDEVDPIGGADIFASATYNNAVVSINDEGLWGSNAALSACFYNPDGDFICDDDDFGSDVGCGSAALINSPIANNFVTVFLYTAWATDELEVCGATFGVISVNFF